MNDAKLTRELKEIIYYIRQYGIDRVKKSVKEILADQMLMEQFHIQVHKGFYLAQERVLKLLPKILNEEKRLKKELAEARRQHNHDQVSLLNNSLRKAKFHECVVRKCMDAIAWQLFNYEISTLRRLYCGDEPIDITDSNIESEITYLTQFQKDSPEGFALVSDLTSFVQIGDIVTRVPNQGIDLIELKEGVVNERIFQLICDSTSAENSEYLESKLRSENKSFIKHFERTVKQIHKDCSTCSTINKGYGIDHASGLNVHIMDGDFLLDSFSPVMHSLSVECHSLLLQKKVLTIWLPATESFSLDGDVLSSILRRVLSCTLEAIPTISSFFDQPKCSAAFIYQSRSSIVRSASIITTFSVHPSFMALDSREG